MQFSVLAMVAALAASASAVYVPVNGTSSAIYYPTGTVSVKPSGTGAAKPTSQLPFTGAAAMPTGSALGLIVAGGVALVSSVPRRNSMSSYC